MDNNSSKNNTKGEPTLEPHKSTGARCYNEQLMKNNCPEDKVVQRPSEIEEMNDSGVDSNNASLIDCRSSRNSSQEDCNYQDHIKSHVFIKLSDTSMVSDLKTVPFSLKYLDLANPDESNNNGSQIKSTAPLASHSDHDIHYKQQRLTNINKNRNGILRSLCYLDLANDTGIQEDSGKLLASQSDHFLAYNKVHAIHHHQEFAVLSVAYLDLANHTEPNPDNGVQRSA